MKFIKLYRHVNNIVETFRFFALLLLFGSLVLSCNLVDFESHQVIVTTTAVSNIQNNLANAGGKVEFSGRIHVREKGLCWSKSPIPNINSSRSFEGEGNGEFVSLITGLETQTAYFVRAYALTNKGLFYGEVQPFVTIGDEFITDIDGNHYTIINIGEQVWMSKNLQTTRLKDGTALDYPGTNINGWFTNYTGAYAYYRNNDNHQKDTFGALYNWHAVETSLLCPEGWRVPTNADWEQLFNFLGGTVNASTRLKSVLFWQESEYPGTNVVGFNALPAGYRSFDGIFSTLGRTAYFWSSDEVHEHEAWGRGLYHDVLNVYKVNYMKRSGMSVRCLME